MAGGNTEGPGFPTSGLFAALLLVVTAVVVHQLPYVVSRPPISDLAWRQFVATQDVDARLWQDPFAAVIQHLDRAQSQARSSTDDKIESTRHSADALTQGLQGQHGATVVMPVMVSGSRYSEDIEGRRRTRYAIVSALNKLGFTPADAEHIGFYRSRPPTDGVELPPIIPWEWFAKTRPSTRETSASAVLVLWLDASAFGALPPRGPLTTLQRLLSDLGLCPGGSPSHAPVVLIGPASSDDLWALLHDEIPPPKSCLAGLSIYSPWATASWPSYADPGVTLAPAGIRFTTMIGTDRSLMPALRDELQLRGVKPLGQHTVAVVAEFDTRYGREIVEVVRRGLCERRDGDNDCANVYSLGYLRGLDGQIPRRSEAKDTTAAGKPADSQPSGSSSENIERAEGDSQFDYLRRLATRMRSKHEQLVRDGSFGISAVGVLGSDLYDKLLVLQAIRQEFPEAVFFTTDLDARYLHPREFQWTRNLIVASSFGLRLREEIQENLPPFRNNYQTATFLAATIAVVNAAPGGQGRVPPETIQDWLSKPRIYEIGRTEAVDLSQEPSGQHDARGGACQILIDCGSIHPLPVFFDRPYAGTLKAWGFAGFLAVILIPLISSNVRRSLTETLRWCGRHPAHVAIILLPAAAAVELFVLGILTEGGRGEPFRFFEGVSIWPTEILRAASLSIAILGIVMTEIRRTRTEQALRSQYFQQPPPSGDVPRVADLVSEAWAVVRRLTTGLVDGAVDEKARERLRAATWRRVCAGKPGRGYFRALPYVDVEKLWAEHCYQNASVARWTRILICSVLFYALGASIMFALGMPVTPARGHFTRIADRTVILFNVFVLIVLIFCVGDTIKLCDKFAYYLGAPVPNRWPPDTRTKYGVGSPNAETPLDSWIDIRFVAEWTGRIGGIIYYPFVVLLLMIVARSSIFDNWDMRPALISVLLLSIAVASATVFVLRGAAERLRRVSMERLTAALVLELGRVPEEPAARQLRTILDEVRDLKQGAFAPITSQPLVRAALLPLSGAGGIALIEYFFLRR